MKAIEIPSQYICASFGYTMKYEAAYDENHKPIKMIEGKDTLECATYDCAEKGKKYLLPLTAVELKAAP